MMSGYRITEHEVQNCLQSVFPPNVVIGKWRFSAVEKPMSRAKDFEDAYDRMMVRLRVAHSLAFKPWKLSPALQFLGGLLVVLLGFGIWEVWRAPFGLGFTMLASGLAVAGAIGIAVVLWLSRECSG